VPEEQRHDDRADQGEDQVGLAQVAALEAPRPLHLADVGGGEDADEHHRREHVDEQREPALPAEPRDRRGLRDDRDQRHHDRRQEHEEAPEDERVDQAGDEPQEQLALSEHDDGLRLHPLRHLPGPLDRLAEAHEPREQERAPREQRARDRDADEEGEAADHDQPPRTRRISAEIAGRT
jgi:hypothetical protein